MMTGRIRSAKSVHARPTIFIGSSSEGLRIAERLPAGLEEVADCKLWTQGVFGVGQVTLEELVKATKEHDFAILVLTPDDLATMRGKRSSIPRDNVIFELGLFMGALGKDRTFIVQSRKKGIRLPSDLDGITRATFLPRRAEATFKQLRQAIKRAPKRLRNLTGRWYSSYQSHDTAVGQWIDHITEVRSKGPYKLSFKSYKDRMGSKYEAVGEFSGQEIVGVWREAQPEADATGTFQLYVDPYGHTMYGICTGPGPKHKNLYSGWILARKAGKLVNAKRQLAEAMLVRRKKRLTPRRAGRTVD